MNEEDFPSNLEPVYITYGSMGKKPQTVKDKIKLLSEEIQNISPVSKDGKRDLGFYSMIMPNKLKKLK